ncbi:hypothetical protein BC834DRAFT_458337 [Gloeopeniophorella convolvens]|nr:hypothetical protein BC834DRAFT_458337 [Gloeopeniophorella convolvens]
MLATVTPSALPIRSPKQGNFDQIVNGNLSWSQYAAPAPAGWRSQFLYARQWEMIIDRRAANDYSDKEREAEWVALESQRRDLALRLCSEVEAPPPLQRKTTIPLPLTTPRPRASEIMSRCKTSRAYRDLPAVDDPSPTNGLRKQHSISQAQVRNARPSLSVTIPGSQHQPQLLSGPLYTSPLSMSGLNVTLPSVLLDSKVIRTHLDNVHGPHRFPIPPESPQLAYPSSSLPRRLVLNPQMGASVVPEPTGVPQLPAGVLSLNFDIFTTHVSVQSGVVIRQPRPVYSFGALKRRASQDDFSVHATKKIRTY